MDAPRFDIKARWTRAAKLMEARGIDAVFLMKPATLAYLTGDGRRCALGLLTRSLQCVVSVPVSDLRSVRAASAATDVRAFRSEEEMFHGFRDVLKDLGLTEATIALEKNFFDASLYEVFKAHILPKAAVVPAGPVLSQLRMLKEPEEVECLQAAGRVADEGMAAAVRAIRPGVREVEVAGEAEYAMRKAGPRDGPLPPTLPPDGGLPWRMGRLPPRRSRPGKWYRCIWLPSRERTPWTSAEPSLWEACRARPWMPAMHTCRRRRRESRQPGPALP